MMLNRNCKFIQFSFFLSSLFFFSFFRHIKSITAYGGITSIDMHKDGSTVVIGAANGSVQLYDLRSKADEPFHSFKAHSSSLYCLKFFYEVTRTKEQDQEQLIMRKNQTIEQQQQQLMAINNNPRVLVNRTNNETVSTTTGNIKESTQLSFNIYSPDCIRTTAIAESTRAQQQSINSNASRQTTSVGNSFVLHKNNAIDALSAINPTNSVNSPNQPVTPVTNGFTVNKPNQVINNKNLNLKSKSFFVWLVLNFSKLISIAANQVNYIHQSCR